ncbi:MAG TPA: tetratricopeptide repeat protein [Gemmataceae bacterium]|nr:tetratricopeptide repeat protein [Gemmataceae bacterium]
MSKLCSLRCSAGLVLTCLLLFTLSCSREKGADAPKGTDKDTPNVVDTSGSNKVIEEATEAIGRDPNGVDERSESAYARRGRAYADKKEYDKAIADYTEAVRVYQAVKPRFFRPRLLEAYNGRAACHQRKGEFDTAIADYGEVIQLGRGGFADLGEAMIFGGFAAEAHYKRGICYDEKGNHTKAMVDYKEAVRLSPALANNEDLKKRMGK